MTRFHDRLIACVTLRAMANGLMHVYRHDPNEGARKVGILYGQVFKRAEVIYDATRGLRTIGGELT